MALPRLPDATVLKSNPQFDPGNISPRVSVEGIGRGQMFAARAIESAGTAIKSVGTAIEANNAADEKMDFLKADSQWNVAKVEQSTKFDNDQNYTDLPQRYEQSLRESRDAAAANITNPRAKQMFILKSEDDIARGKVAALGVAKKLEADQNLGWLDQQQESTINALINNPDPQQRAEGITSHRALIKSFAEKGWLTQQQVFDRDSKFRNTYAVSFAESQARAGKTDQVISDLEAAQLNAANAPAPQRPPQRLGELSAKYESKSNWGAAGKDNIGWAFGAYQFNSRGSLKDFLSDHPEIAKKFAGINPESQAFADRWREVSKELGPQFQEAQQQTFVRHAGPSMERATALGFKMDDRGVVESVLSGSIQHGKWPQVLAKAASVSGFSAMSAEDQVKTLYKARADYVSNLGTIDDTTRAGVLTRYRDEIKDALGMVGQPVGEQDPVKVASTDPNFVPTPPQKPSAEAVAASPSQRAPTIFDAMGAPERERLLTHMRAVKERQEREATGEALKLSTERREGYERRMLDAAVGKSDLPPREEIENDTSLNPTHKNEALRQWGTAAKDMLSFKAAYQRFSNNEAFNPYDKEDRKNADRLFQGMKGDDVALTAVIQRTGIMPESAATKMRADLISNDPKRVVGAMTRASNALSINQNVMTGFDGADDLEKNAVKFRALVDNFGLSAEAAANRIIRDQSPEYKASVNARIKGEDVDDLIKKKVTPANIESQFDASFWGLARNPKLGSTFRARDKMFDQYASLVKEHYLDGGDIDLAKKTAAHELKKVWGTSSVNGSEVIMPYPPERAPAYQGIPDVSDRIALHAVEEIKRLTGEDIPRGKIVLGPTARGETASNYKAGQTPPYELAWFDKNGILQMLPPGKALMVEPYEMRATLTEGRRVKFDQLRSRSEADAAAHVSPGMVTGGEFGSEVQGGFSAPAPATAVPQVKSAPEILPGIGDVAIPGGAEAPAPELPSTEGKPYRNYWQQMRERQGGGFTGGAR